MNGRHIVLTQSASLRPLRYVAIIGPIGFAVGVGLLNELVLERTLAQPLAAAVATIIVAAGAIAFASWIFHLLSRIQEQMSEVARLQERERIALQLHDEVIQSIYAIQLNLQASLERSVPQDVRDGLHRAIEDLTDVSIGVRRHIFDLRLQLAGQADLERAPGHLAEDARVNSLISAELEIKGPVVGLLSEEQAEAVFLVTREALANAARHARASLVHVRLADLGDGIQLEVIADGAGFDPRPNHPPDRNGLRKMISWAESVGGRLQVDSAEGRGTRIQLRLPVTQAEDHADERPLIAPKEGDPPASG